MLRSDYSEYYGKKPDQVSIPDGWERLPGDWFRKPLPSEYYVNKIGTIAVATPTVLKRHPERVIIKKSQV